MGYRELSRKTVLWEEADCVIPINTGESLMVPKGTGLVPMIDATHHNASWTASVSWFIPTPEKYWSDPYRFRPSRFLGDYNKDAFLPFSTGARIQGLHRSQVRGYAFALP